VDIMVATTRPWSFQAIMVDTMAGIKAGIAAVTTVATASTTNKGG
jgi:hypothetical protein